MKAGPIRRAGSIELTGEGLILRLADGEVIALDPFGLSITLPVELLRVCDPAPAVDTESHIDTKEKARLLAVDRATVYRHAKDLGGRKVGGVWRFPKDSLRSVAEDGSRDVEKPTKGRRKAAPEKRSRTLKVRGKRPEEGV